MTAQCNLPRDSPKSLHQWAAQRFPRAPSRSWFSLRRTAISLIV